MFGDIVQMPDEIDAKKIPPNSFPLENWKIPPGCSRTMWMKTIQQDLKSNNLSLNEAIDMAQSHPHSRLVFVWHYALLLVHARNE